MKKLFVTVLILMFTVSGNVIAESYDRIVSPPESKMNNAYLDKLIRKIDKNARGKMGYWQFMVEDSIVTVITDENADRMRIIVPVIKVENMKKGILKRVMQANFDSALDARYALARGVLWSAYIHPLSPLKPAEFLKGVGQVVNLKYEYGSSYSSGALLFGGGDSKAPQRKKLIEKLLNQGLAI